MARRPKILFLMLLCLTPMGVSAMGLGDIELKSALNQPLSAEIELISATRAELRSLEASLASQETFNRYGLERPHFLNSLAFSVSRSADGRDVLRVSSRQPIPEPFVTFLVEANWARGRLLREYTVLLDPPVFMPAQEQAPPTRVAEPTRAQPAPQGRVVRTPEPAARAPEPAAPAPEPRPAAAPLPARPPATSATEYGPVRRNETLWNIATQLRPDSSVDVNRMMIALFRANPQAFADNINILKRGAILRIPEPSEILALGRAEVYEEVVRHNEAWQSGRAMARAPAGADSSAARLRLVPPADAGGRDASAAGSGRGDDATAQQLAAQRAENRQLRDQMSDLEADLADTRRLIEIRDAEIAALQQSLQQAAEVEPPTLADSTLAPPDVAPEPGIEDTAPIEAPPPDTTVADVTDPAPLADPADARTPPPQTRAATQVPAVVSSPSSAGQSLLDSVADMLGNMWLWIIVAGVTFLLAMLIFARRRQEAEDVSGTWEALAEDSDLDEFTGTSTERLRQVAREHDESIVVIEEEDTGDTADDKTVLREPPAGAEEPFISEAGIADTGTSPAMVADTGTSPVVDETLSSTAISLDQADPIAEADFHMAYGLYDQAAELVQKAAALEPDRRDYKLKLLEIFFVWGNKDSFLRGAHELRQSMANGPDADWDKILIMGKQICPDDALFAGEPATAGTGVSVDLDLEASGDSEAEIDLLTDDGQAGGTAAQEFDLDLSEALGADSTAEQPAMTDEEVFDIGAPDGDTMLSQTAREEGIPDADADAGGGTAELELDDLGLDLDLGDTAEQPVSDDILAGQGEEHTAVLDEDVAPAASLDQTRMQPLSEGDTRELEQAVEATESTGVERAAVADDTRELERVLDLEETREMETPETLADADATGEMPAIEDTAEHDIGAGMIASPDDSDLDDTMEARVDLDLGKTTEAKVDLDLGKTMDAPMDLDLEESLATSIDADVGAREEPAAADPLSDTDVRKAAVDVDDDTANISGITEIGIDTEVLAAEDLPDASATAEVAQLPGDVDLDLDDLTAALSAIDSDATGTHALPPAMPEASEGFSPEARSESADDTDDHQATVRIAPAELALPDTEAETLSEVGTKLDLARAYMDMGDPDGARSILEEVLEEGDDSQQQEAQKLMAALP